MKTPLIRFDVDVRGLFTLNVFLNHLLSITIISSIIYTEDRSAYIIIPDKNTVTAITATKTGRRQRSRSIYPYTVANIERIVHNKEE